MMQRDPKGAVRQYGRLS